MVFRFEMVMTPILDYRMVQGHRASPRPRLPWAVTPRKMLARLFSTKMYVNRFFTLSGV